MDPTSIGTAGSGAYDNLFDDIDPEDVSLGDVSIYDDFGAEVVAASPGVSATASSELHEYEFEQASGGEGLRLNESADFEFDKNGINSDVELILRQGDKGGDVHVDGHQQYTPQPHPATGELPLKTTVIQTFVIDGKEVTAVGGGISASTTGGGANGSVGSVIDDNGPGRAFTTAGPGSVDRVVSESIKVPSNANELEIRTNIISEYPDGKSLQSDWKLTSDLRPPDTNGILPNWFL